MKRYKFLQKDDVFSALDRIRDAFLAAKDGNDVEEIINGILTFDERMKIGRRIQIAEYLLDGFGIDEITQYLKVGKTTITQVSKNVEKYIRCFELLSERKRKVKRVYEDKRYRLIGGSKKVFKKKEYTGFKQKDVIR